MSKKDINETLANEIGAIGADESEMTLGKLQHKASYGQKEDLDNAEQESLNRFLNKGKQLKSESEADEVEVSAGWIPIDREQMGVRSTFYSPNWEFFIKPATMNAIKNWTAIDESRPEQLNRVFDEIVKQCVKIDTHSLSSAGWAQINSWDRFWLILKVREYTFNSNSNNIEFEDDCTECGQPIKYTLTSDALHYAFPDDDLINDYWNGREWVIDPREYDVDYEPITLYTPTLGKDAAIIEWATAKAHAGHKLDETFIEFLIWMLDKPSKDMQMLDRQIKKLYKEYKMWSVDMFAFMRDVIKNITINPSENLTTRCPHCGQETVSGVQFPNGIHELFNSGKTNRKKFGSR